MAAAAAAAAAAVADVVEPLPLPPLFAGTAPGPIPMESGNADVLTPAKLEIRC